MINICKSMFQQTKLVVPMTDCQLKDYCCQALIWKLGRIHCTICFTQFAKNLTLGIFLWLRLVCQFLILVPFGLYSVVSRWPFQGHGHGRCCCRAAEAAIASSEGGALRRVWKRKIFLKPQLFWRKYVNCWMQGCDRLALASSQSRQATCSIWDGSNSQNRHDKEFCMTISNVSRKVHKRYLYPFQRIEGSQELFWLAAGHRNWREEGGKGGEGSSGLRQAAVPAAALLAPAIMPSTTILQYKLTSSAVVLMLSSCTPWFKSWPVSSSANVFSQNFNDFNLSC